MKKFLAIYIGTASSPKSSEWKAMDEGKRKKLEAPGIKAWGDWMTAHKSAVVDTGGPLGKTKRTSAQGVASPATRSRSWNAYRFRGSSKGDELFF
jgi:hypothetical protein